ncbi:hypothetical protein BD309DRAFT_989392 [Dichomitus squalens]|nr:hypothetical protein BD309DRAFT_989392 [Dichomitus squalens]
MPWYRTSYPAAPLVALQARQHISDDDVEQNWPGTCAKGGQDVGLQEKARSRPADRRVCTKTRRSSTSAHIDIGAHIHILRGDISAGSPVHASRRSSGYEPTVPAWTASRSGVRSQRTHLRPRCSSRPVATLVIPLHSTAPSSEAQDERREGMAASATRTWACGGDLKID